MLILDYAPFITFAVLVQCLFGIVYLSTYQWQRNKWLVLVFMSMFSMQLGIFTDSEQLSIYQKIFMGNPGILMAVPPSLYLFTKELVQVHIKRRVILIHFLPAFIFYILSLFSNQTQPKVLIVAFSNGNFQIIALTQILAIFIISLVYVGLILRLIRHNRKKYKNEYAETSIFLTLDWLKYLVIIILTLSSTAIFAIIFSQYFTELYIPHFWVELVFLLIIFATSYFAFRQPTLYQRTKNIASGEENIETGDDNEIKPLLDETQIEKISIDLENYLSQQQPFLNSKIRMPEIAAAINITPNELSWFLNEHKKTNFFSFINELRINYAAQLLINENYQQYTLEALSKMAGFQSKTTFNNWFKKIKNVTPSAFRKVNKKS